MNFSDKFMLAKRKSVFIYLQTWAALAPPGENVSSAQPGSSLDGALVCTSLGTAPQSSEGLKCPCGKYNKLK